jgi:NAD binding domain of 6-phosphogluconate dehydrogenase
MARNLIQAGHTLTVYNRARSRAEALQGAGAKVTETPADATAHADALITMLADDHAVEAVIAGAGGVLQALPQSAIHVGMSTSNVALSRRLAAAHQEKEAVLCFCLRIRAAGCCRCRQAVHFVFDAAEELSRLERWLEKVKHRCPALKTTRIPP